MKERKKVYLSSSRKYIVKEMTAGTYLYSRLGAIMTLLGQYTQRVDFRVSQPLVFCPSAMLSYCCISIS
jgi:hypothetical protein